jgi:hypothetical protein
MAAGIGREHRHRFAAHRQGGGAARMEGAQPDGRRIALGTSPASTMRVCAASGSGTGIALSSARV